MLKVIGMIMIITSCSAIGFSLSRKYVTRTKNIKCFISALEIIKAELLYKNETPEDIYEKLLKSCCEPAKYFFQRILSNINKNTDTPADNDGVYDDLRKYLNHEEITEIKNALSVLGKYDIESQAEIFTKSLCRLEEIYSSAVNEHQKNGKLFQTAGVTIGIVVALVLL